MYESGSGFAGSKPAVNNADAHGRDREASSAQSSVVERLSRYGMQVMPGAFTRRSRLQRLQEVSDVCAAGAPSREPQERGSLTPSVRKRYLKELLLNNSLSSALSAQSHGASFQEDTDWALSPMEHAWMLSAVEGSYDTILDFLSEDPNVLTRRDFISGYSVLHWLSKRGRDETLIKVFRYAESAGVPVDVNLRGSGGLTPLHVASMHGHYMVVKLLVGAFGADVDARDYSGRRAWQYLRGDAPAEMKELLGAWDDQHSCACAAQSANRNVNNNCGGSVEQTGEEGHPGGTDGGNNFEHRRKSTWPYGSFRKLLSSFPFLGSKT
ncbi:ankyrin repeat domain-containing protein SOWAHD [Cololabis saira]|uniref:ankyrin repeat domain-containing protein SOWAHD n=1 Tax=Cololabis saira TaxID=129043 RepID=UPI002AD5746F|nr:ankyrin repeat domain-containing protein SOWAHD [Cololabis saira]